MDETQAHHAWLVMRMFVRLNEQAEAAWRAGRIDDSSQLNRICGRLEYAHFGMECFHKKESA